mmetsp:Transcript_2214/g.3533  ORF Transcript_2214/g.3533 Transcript_2214/m.3533 type:complete len:173 (+) Transcript_2214:19-537(+)
MIEELGLDNYAVLFYKLTTYWILGLVLQVLVGIWWAVTDLVALVVPVFGTLSGLGLLACKKFILKTFLKKNTPLQTTCVIMCLVALGELGISVWTSVVVSVNAEVITNLAVSWVLSLGFIVTGGCLILPITVVLWHIRSEDIVKANLVAKQFEAPPKVHVSNQNETKRETLY